MLQSRSDKSVNQKARIDRAVEQQSGQGGSVESSAKNLQAAERFGPKGALNSTPLGVAAALLKVGRHTVGRRRLRACRAEHPPRRTEEDGEACLRRREAEGHHRPVGTQVETVPGRGGAERRAKVAREAGRCELQGKGRGRRKVESGGRRET